MDNLIEGIGLGIVFLVLVFLIHLYLNGNFRHRKTYRIHGLSADSSHFLTTVASLSDSLMVTGQVSTFWSNIDEIQAARLALINQAQTLIQFETFIMTPGKRAQDFAQALQQKASAGVDVQILVDSYGAKSLPNSYWRSLTNAGVSVQFFNPFSARAPFDYLRRNHRKLLIVDQTVAMVGGAGIAGRWDGKDQHAGNVPWYDFETEWRGDVVGALVGFFWQHWVAAGGQVNLAHHQPQKSQANDPAAVLITPGEDPSTGDSPIRSLFQLCITAAQKRLWIASPYLLPDDATGEMLAAIKRNGVDVRILTMGPKSDKHSVYCVSRERYQALLAADIKIHEYQPSMMHGKIILIDNHWVSLGSANLDPRSFFHNDELNLCTDSANLTQQVEDFFKVGFERSQLIQTHRWKQRPLKEKLMGSFGRVFYWQL
jgi:cardiolipin synthase